MIRERQRYLKKRFNRNLIKEKACGLRETNQVTAL